MKKSFVQAVDTPFGTLVTVDAVGIVRESLKARIQDTAVREYLPFLTSVSDGLNHFHIRNDSAYPVDTKYHTIEQGDTLCGRGGDNNYTVSHVSPTCPGCIAKAKNIIVTHLLDLATGNPSEGVDSAPKPQPLQFRIEYTNAVRPNWTPSQIYGEVYTETNVVRVLSKARRDNPVNSYRMVVA